MSKASTADETIKVLDYVGSGLGKGMESVTEIAVKQTKAIIEAATPVAKQAYEIGLLTIQIDGLESILYRIMFFLMFFFMWRMFLNKYRTYKALPRGEKDNGDETARFIAACVCFIAMLVALFQVLSIWAWVKIFKPELWLANQAINAALAAVKN